RSSATICCDRSGHSSSACSRSRPARPCSSWPSSGSSASSCRVPWSRSTTPTGRSFPCAIALRSGARCSRAVSNTPSAISSSLSLSPRAVGVLGRSLGVVALVGGVFFGIAEARSTELSFDAALGLARDAVARVEPGDELLAAVVRYASEAHALAKPQKYNFYFRSQGSFEIVRVGFPDTDQNAMEVRHDDEDGLDYAALQPLGPWAVTGDRALE